MWFFRKKLSFYAVKTKNNNLACCSITEEPLIANDKDKLKKLLKSMKEKDDRYINCKIVKVCER